MFCPVCWKEYPKGMRTCDHCRAELIEENPKEHEEHEHQEPSESSGQAEEKKPEN